MSIKLSLIPVVLEIIENSLFIFKISCFEDKFEKLRELFFMKSDLGEIGNLSKYTYKGLNVGVLN